MKAFTTAVTSLPLLRLSLLLRCATIFERKPLAMFSFSFKRKLLAPANRPKDWDKEEEEEEGDLPPNLTGAIDQALKGD